MTKDKDNKIFFRNILLSTGELVEEAVIRYRGKEFYDSSPVGLTLGLEETQNNDEDKNNSVDFLDLLIFKIPNLTHQEFDTEISKNLPSQKTTGLSLAYAKLLAYINHSYSVDEFFSYIREEYKTNKFPKKNIKVISNILNGGLHANSELAFCEFMIIPNSSNLRESIKISSDIYLELEKIIQTEDIENKVVPIGREAGFVPMVNTINKAIGLVNNAILEKGERAFIAIDVAANNFSEKIGDGFVYTIDGKKYSTEELVDLYIELLDKYPLLKYLEDPFHEYDKKGWKMLLNRVKEDIMIVSDDLSISKLSKLQENDGLFNASILKMNQAGTLTDLFNSFSFCENKKVKTIISQRSGETDSSSISHLAVGLNSDFVKIGAPARDRIVKYNELLRIYSKLVD